MAFQIAIDGPTASGKSTIASAVAKKFNLYHIDTGMMYRAVTYMALNNNLTLDDENSYDFIDNLEIKIINNQMNVNGKFLGKELRDPKIDKNISVVSNIRKVRQKLVEIQRQLANERDVILDGRDIGTVVLPNADLKIFLTASSDERSKRRYLELISRKTDINLEEVKSDLLKRDLKDSTRDLSPLKKADDAISLDTTNLNIDEVVEIIGNMILNKKNEER